MELKQGTESAGKDRHGVEAWSVASKGTAWAESTDREAQVRTGKDAGTGTGTGTGILF